MNNRDPYTVSEDGHIVGHDGFVVPKNFTEFYAQHPHHVRNFVRFRWTHKSFSDLADREQELLLHLMNLPADSKFRQPGFNGLENGCEDRIQVFHPDSAYGASAKRFFWYINHCLRNHFFSQDRKAISNPVRRASTMTLDLEGEISDKGGLHFIPRLLVTHAHTQDYLVIDEFLEYVDLHNPDLLAILDVIGQAETFVDAQRQLGMTERRFNYSLNRIRRLHRYFLAGETPPRQRKVYQMTN